MTPAIELRDVSRRFGGHGLFSKTPVVTAVDRVNLSVAPGEVLGIVGESGCGKTTLARLILGLIEPSSGSVLVDGKRLSSLSRQARARLIQPVFQDPYSSLNPKQRVRDIVALPLRVQGASDVGRKVADMLARVGLPGDMQDRYPEQLSGGQRQRVALARALSVHPRVAVLDEPTSALDVSVQAQILNLLAELRRELGLTYVLISHNLAVVEHVATRVAVMYLGRVVELDTTQALFRNPRHPYTRALLASVLTPEPGLGIPDPKLGDTAPDPANIAPGCRFHPRCPMAEDRCRRDSPDGLVAEGRLVECLLEAT